MRVALILWLFLFACLLHLNRSLRLSISSLQRLPFSDKTNKLSSQPSNSRSPLCESDSNFCRMPTKNDDSTFVKLLWPRDNPRLKLFLISSLVCMFAGKWFGVQIPFVLQAAIDSCSTIDPKNTPFSISSRVSVAILAYSIARAFSVVFAELKTTLFAFVCQDAIRNYARDIFATMLSLGADFHLQNPSGVVSVAYVRAVRGIQTLLFQIVFSVAPTMLELVMVCSVLYRKFGLAFSAVMFATFLSYFAFTVIITNWRIAIRRGLVDVDNARNGRFVDTILNHEVVKLFNRQQHEIQSYDGYLDKIEGYAIESTIAIALLNFGQALLFSLGLGSCLLMGLQRIHRGELSVGDLIAINGLLLQLALPFNFMGYTYQEIRQSLVDMNFMTSVLKKNHLVHVGGSPVPTESSKALHIPSLTHDHDIELDHVSFSYSTSDTPEAPSRDTPNSLTMSMNMNVEQNDTRKNSCGTVLHDINIRLPLGQSIAIVGPSGSGKSTLLRLIAGLLAPSCGTVHLVNQQSGEIVSSFQHMVGMILQEASLFDRSLEENLKYGSPLASDSDLLSIVKLCGLQARVDSLPQGLKTIVGEKGGRLSGGERQKVAIARALLKKPDILLCDEITASLDAFSERDVMDCLHQIPSTTKIIVAHRLETIQFCDRILVLNNGRLVEEGNHVALMRIPGGFYRSMWQAQHQNK